MALNLTQSVIMRLALLGVLLLSAVDVIAGQSTIGDYVAMMTWVAQLFVPLAWLGSLYTMIQARCDARAGVVAGRCSDTGMRSFTRCVLHRVHAYVFLLFLLFLTAGARSRRSRMRGTWRHC